MNEWWVSRKSCWLHGDIRIRQQWPKSARRTSSYFHSWNCKQRPSLHPSHKSNFVYDYDANDSTLLSTFVSCKHSKHASLSNWRRYSNISRAKQRALHGEWDGKHYERINESRLDLQSPPDSRQWLFFLADFNASLPEKCFVSINEIKSIRLFLNVFGNERWLAGELLKGATDFMTCSWVCSISQVAT